MCFFGGNQTAMAGLRLPSAPSRESEEARRRVRQQQQANETQRGRRATILTSPLGDPGFGQQVNRTVLTGMAA